MLADWAQGPWRVYPKQCEARVAPYSSRFAQPGTNVSRVKDLRRREAGGG